MLFTEADINEAPVLTPVNVSFNENQATGTVLLPRIDYTDQDSGDYSTFTLVRVCKRFLSPLLFPWTRYALRAEVLQQ